MTTLTLIGKPDCHLCDVASEIIDTVIAEMPDAAAENIEIVEASIQEDPALYDLWWEKIPVVLIDGELHAHWRLSADRLRSALEEAATRAESSDDDRAATRAVLSDQRETK